MVISMDRWKSKVAVVTGASSGIGAAIVEHLVDAEIHVVGLARREEKLKQLEKKLEYKSGKFHGVVADTTKEDDILKAFQWIKNNVGPVHIIVNNAGIGRSTSLVDGDTKMWKEVLDTNVLGLCIATREAVKDMRANNVDGHIIHINSIVGHRTFYYPDSNVYNASKYAVTSLTETLRQELLYIKSKIKITSISPGLVQTEYFEAMVRDSGEKEMPQYMQKYLKTSSVLQPSDVADAVISVLSTPPHVQILELTVCPM